MLKIAICDDAPQHLFQIRDLLESWNNRPDHLHIDTYTDADSLIASHHVTPYDIILMDVVMPLLNGIDAAKEIRQFDTVVRIVFLTFSTEFAIDAFAVRASHYLLKPVDPKALYDCLNELYKEIFKQTESIMIHCNNSIQRVPLLEIESIEARLKHMLITLANGDTLWATEPLYYFENRLLSLNYFFKCHRSYIVNLYHVRSFTKKDLFTLSGRTLPISRNSSKDFESAYMNLLFAPPQKVPTQVHLSTKKAEITIPR